MPTNADFEARIGRTLCDKWRIEKLLGVGGMAAVYLVKNRIGHREAIKMLHPDFAKDEGVRKRFEREAFAANRIEHPGVVQIRDFEHTSDGVPFLVMEYLEGHSFRDLTRQSGIAIDELLRVVDGVLDVLVVAHAANIIHRDIKPDNVFVLNDGTVKVLDFGIARVRMDVQSMFTREGDLLGTTAYMPPEQVRGEQIDGRADLFAVGATMFRVAARRPIHRAKGESQRLLLMATEPAPPIASVMEGLPEMVCKVVDRALQFRRAGRYPDARTMQGDVRALRNNAPPPFATGSVGPAPDEPSSLSSFSGDGEPTSTSGPLEDGSEAPTTSRPSEGSISEDPTRPRAGVDPTPFDEDTIEHTIQGLVGSRLDDRYVLKQVIGRGGMGAVYDATNDDGEHFAIKMVLTQSLASRSKAATRFRREAQTAASIESPHVVGFVEASVDEKTGAPFIVMERLDGHDLETQLRQTKPMPEDVVARVFTQACRGVIAAHQRKVIHRDIKPANLFLAQEPTGVVVKVLDFGLSKNRQAAADSHSLTQSGSVLGTPKYASPEQMTSASSVDARTDVWGLCVSMWEALTGRQPWSECETIAATIVAICTTQLDALQQVAPWVSPALAAIVDKGMRRVPDERWQSVEELMAALEPHLGGDVLLDEAMLQRDADTGGMSARPSSSGLTDLNANVSVPAMIAAAPVTQRRSVLLPVGAAVAIAAGGLGAWYLSSTPNDSAEPNLASTRPSATATAAPQRSPQPTATAAAPVSASVTPSAASSAPSAAVAPKPRPRAIRHPTPQPVLPAPEPAAPAPATAAPKLKPKDTF